MRPSSCHATVRLHAGSPPSIFYYTSYYFAPAMGAKYCDQCVSMYVCLFVCLFLCLSARIPQKLHDQNFHQIFCIFAAKRRSLRHSRRLFTSVSVGVQSIAICVSVCLSVSSYIYQKQHVQSSPHVLYMSAVTVARSF